MSDVRRYKVSVSGARIHSLGNWVTYDSYQKLKKEFDKLEECYFEVEKERLALVNRVRGFEGEYDYE